MSGADLDEARRLVVERSLVRAAFDLITVDAMMALPFESLGPTKALLKRFFSTDPWGTEDDEALAAAVGPGEGTWRHDLDSDVVLRYGWEDNRFGVRVERSAGFRGELGSAGEPVEQPAGDSLAGTFDGPVVPEATPNPRSIRFQVGPIHGGTSRWYESAAAAADDPGSARLFAEFEEVANVLVGPDFVAVGLRRATDWERLLRPILAVVTDEFADPDAPPDKSGPRVMGGPAGAGSQAAAHLRRLPGRRPPADGASAGWSGRGPTSAPSTRGRPPTTWPRCGRRRRATTPPAARWRPACWARPIRRWRPPTGPGWWSIPSAPSAGPRSTRWSTPAGPSCDPCWRRPWPTPTPGSAGRRCGAWPSSAPVPAGSRCRAWPTIPTSGSAWRWPPPSAKSDALGAYSQTWVKMAVTVPVAVVSDSDPRMVRSGPAKEMAKSLPPNSGGKPGISSREP